MRLRSIIFVLAFPVLVAYGQERPRNVTAPQNELSAFSQLIGTTADGLRNEYNADTQFCGLPLRSYVSLRLAEQRYHFDRGSVLRQMCTRRTTSFAIALQSAGGTYGTLTSPGPKQNQELRDAERDFAKQIAGALNARPH